MCGIAGIMFRKGQPVLQASLQRMADSLHHRGPDGEGFYQDHAVGFAHRRLAIIDPEGGVQPQMDRNSVLIANAEIYNFMELRAAFPDYHWKSRSDCEVILPLFARGGVGALDRLRGMFALALYCPESRKLTLARDPFGIKPLYLAELPQGIIFASEPRAILATGLVRRELNQAAALELVCHQFTAGSPTLFRGIRRLEPGEVLEIEDGAIVRRSWLKRPMPAVQDFDDDRIVHERLDQTLTDTMRLHLQSDVPYGLFLSGGIDSTSLLAMMHRLGEQATCLTAAFPGSKTVHSEAECAARMVAHCNGSHQRLDVTAQDFIAYFPAIMAAFDDALADYAMIPAWLLAKQAQEAGLKVMLSGEGGDEFFAGYGRYIRQLTLRRFFSRSRFPKNRLSGTGLLRLDFEIEPSGKLVSSSSWSALQKAQAGDINGWLAPNLLLKLDRCLMAHGVEGRTPFVDTTLSPFAFALPARMKLHRIKGRMVGKWALRSWLLRTLPDAPALAGKKGFTVPVGSWIAEMAPRLGPLLARQNQLGELLHIARLDHFFTHQHRRHSAACWQILALAVWLRVHMDGVDPASHTLWSILE
ncbi:MAG: asparagine synthase (glutamine-hydrolyzing) [Pseudomonadota bacterium]